MKKILIIVCMVLLLVIFVNDLYAKDIQRIELNFDSNENVTNITVFDKDEQNLLSVDNTLSNILKTYLSEICVINQIEDKTLRIMVCTDTSQCTECDTLNYNSFIWNYGYKCWYNNKHIAKKQKTQDFIQEFIISFQNWIADNRQSWGF